MDGGFEIRSRSLLKRGVASALHWTGVDRLYARSATATPLIVTYHRVVEDFRDSARRSIPPMLISVKTFEAHLDWIGRHYRFITLDDLAAWSEGTRPLDRPSAAITFDDGYADVYHNAFPILRRKGIPAAVFVVTDLVGTPRLQIHDELFLLMTGAYGQWRDPARELLRLLLGFELPPPLLERVRGVAGDPLRATWMLFEILSQGTVQRLATALRAETGFHESATLEQRAMDWRMLRTMGREGVTVGTHSRSHPRMSNEGWERLLDETLGSRRAVERKLGTRVEHFAYPGGGFNALAVSAVAAAGYRCAYTSCRHRDAGYPALTIPRRLFWENSCVNGLGQVSPSLMSCHVNGLFDFASPCRQPHG